MPQVVDREEAVAEQLLRTEEVGQVSPAEPTAGRAVTERIKRLIFVQVSCVPQVHPAAGHPGLTVARNSRWEDGIKEVNAAQHRLQ